MAAASVELDAVRNTGTYVVPGLGLRIVDVTVPDPVVAREALRWTAGKRGEPVTEGEACGCDLTRLVHESIAIGARVLAATSDAVGVASLATTVTTLADRAESA